MPVAPSFADYLAQFEAEALAQRPDLAFNDGDITEAQMHGAGAMADALTRYTAQAFKNTFIDGAEDDALTALVDDHVNIQRGQATAAQLTIRLVRTSSGAAGIVPAGFPIASQIDSAGNSVQFTLDADVNFGAADNGPHTGTMTASTAGRASNVAASTVTRLLAAAFDNTITATNPAKAAGGNDAETDPELRVRARNFWTTLRRGTLAALEYGAKLVSSVRIAKAIENATTGITSLVVSDSDGNSTLQMVSDVRTEIVNWRAAGSRVEVLGGTPIVQNVVYSITVYDGVDASVLVPLCNEAIELRMSKLRQGETLTVDMIKGAAMAVDPDSIEAVPVTTPAADVVPLTYQVIRPGTVSGS
jgi:hypothetical protein